MSSPAIASMDELEHRLVAWATPRPDIRTMLVVGSRARTDHPADEWSDLDVAFTTTAPARYAGTGWLDEIGEVWVAFVDPHGSTRHVLFAGGLDAGIAPLPHRAFRALTALLTLRARVPRALAVLPRPARDALDRQVDDVVSYCDRGTRLLLDKDGHGARALALLPARPRTAARPTADQFLATVDEFWFLAVWNAKHLRRGELWAAKTVAVDGRMKVLLLRMIEWHARATRGEEIDTWADGRHLEEWADQGALAALRGAFGHYDDDDLWRASLATMELFRTIAVETARHLDVAYPDAADARISDWVRQCEAGRRVS